MRLAPTVIACLLPLAAFAQDGPTLSLMETDAYGTVLAGPDGQPVYVFKTDTRAGDGINPIESCGPNCLVDWPLVEAPAEITVGEGLDADLATSITWEGQEVLVYDSQPLYGYVGDEGEAQPTGQSVHEHGGWWYLVQADGSVVLDGIAPDPTLMQDEEMQQPSIEAVQERNALPGT